jgi:hypothetical protein
LRFQPFASHKGHVVPPLLKNVEKIFARFISVYLRLGVKSCGKMLFLCDETLTPVGKMPKIRANKD